MRMDHIFAAVLLLSASMAGAAEHYAAPDGKQDGDGSEAKPWDLKTALAQPDAVKPGDTIQLRGGVYQGDGEAFQSRLKGAADQPIRVCGKVGERAIIQPKLTASVGEHVIFQGFEIFNPDPMDYKDNQSGHSKHPTLWIQGIKNAKFINLVIHGGGQGIGAWTPSQDIEIYGCVVFHSGWDVGGQGHHLYTQNETGTKRILDNVMFNTIGNGFGIHAYGSGKAFVDNYVFEGNILFNNNGYEVLIGSGKPSKNIVFRKNMVWHDGDTGKLVKFGYTAPFNENAAVEDNYLASRRIEFLKWNELKVKGNTFYKSPMGLDRAAFPENTYLDEMPKGVKMFVRPNAYEPGRANIAVFNWDNQERVDADLAGALKPGDAYEVRDAQLYLGKPVAEGIYDGKPVALPMKLGEVMQPTSTWRFKHTPLEFGAFVVLKK